MKNVIDLTNYLPSPALMESAQQSRRRFTLSEIVESVVSVLVGAGIFAVLALLVAAL